MEQFEQNNPEMGVFNFLKSKANEGSGWSLDEIVEATKLEKGLVATCLLILYKLKIIEGIEYKKTFYFRLRVYQPNYIV